MRSATAHDRAVLEAITGPGPITLRPLKRAPIAKQVMLCDRIVVGRKKV